MSSYYECKRCSHKTKQKIEMVRHLNRKLKCLRTFQSYKYVDDELDILSLKIIKQNKDNKLNDDEIVSNESDFVPLIDESCDFLSNIHLKNKETPKAPETPEECNLEKNDAKSKETPESPEECNLKKNNIKSKETPEAPEECNLEKDNQVNEILESDKICNDCSKIFTRRSSLLRHITQNRCKNINYTNNNNSNTNNNDNNNNNNNTNNTNNIAEQNVIEQNITNITNNTIIINVNINKPLPFDSDWDVSKIDDKLKNILILSDSKYTKTLEHILENELNLNVIIEDKAENGIVYKNDIEKFKFMKIDDIVNLSMDKLHKHLNSFHDDIKINNIYGINNNLLLTEKNQLDSKYNNFKNEENAKLLVRQYISNIYNKNKDNALNYCKDLLQDELYKIDGY